MVPVSISIPNEVLSGFLLSRTSDLSRILPGLQTCVKSCAVQYIALLRSTDSLSVWQEKDCNDSQIFLRKTRESITRRAHYQPKGDTMLVFCIFSEKVVEKLKLSRSLKSEKRVFFLGWSVKPFEKGINFTTDSFLVFLFFIL